MPTRSTGGLSFPFARNGFDVAPGSQLARADGGVGEDDDVEAALGRVRAGERDERNGSGGRRKRQEQRISRGTPSKVLLEGRLKMGRLRGIDGNQTDVLHLIIHNVIMRMMDQNGHLDLFRCC